MGKDFRLRAVLPDLSRALDVLGERWTVLIVRDLLVGTTRFNDLARGRPGSSRSLLTR